MITIMNAIAALGLPAAGPADAVSEADYANVVFHHGAERPDWSLIAAKIAELSMPNSEDVDSERDRRMATFTFSGVSYDFDAQSRALIDKARVSATNYIFVHGPQPGNLRWADASVDFGWIAADNTFHTMDAEACVSFGTSAAAWEGRHVLAARALKNMTPIPEDYAAAKWWP